MTENLGIGSKAVETIGALVGFPQNKVLYARRVRRPANILIWEGGAKMQ